MGSKIFDWFLLPLLSFCSCGRKKGNCDEIDNKESNQSIDNQPRSSTVHLERNDLPLLSRLGQEETNQSIDCQSHKEESISSVDQLTLNDLPLLPRLGQEEADRSIETRNEESISSVDQIKLNNLLLLPRLGQEEANRSIETRNEESISSVDQLNLNDPPLLPLLGQEEANQSIDYQPQKEESIPSVDQIKLNNLPLLPRLGQEEANRSIETRNEESIASVDQLKLNDLPLLSRLEQEEPSRSIDCQPRNEESIASADQLNLNDPPLLPRLGQEEANRSIDCQPQKEESISSVDQIKLDELPLLPLLKICEHLRTDHSCHDLNKFRYTCRCFAQIVNTFLENSTNLPCISRVEIRIQQNITSIFAKTYRSNYLMHPMRSDQAKQIWDSLMTYMNQTTAYGTIANDENEIEEASEVLRGPVTELNVIFDSNEIDLNKSLTLLRNIVAKRAIFRSQRLTDEIGSLILAVGRAQPYAYVESCCARNMITDFESFVIELDSIAKAVKLTAIVNDSHLRNDFWKQFLLQKLNEGCEVSTGRRRFKPSEISNFLDHDISSLHSIQWNASV